jgi:hypothetical protein
VVGSVMTRKANDATSDVAEARLCGEEDRQAFEDLLRHRALDEWATQRVAYSQLQFIYGAGIIRALGQNTQESV